MFAGLGNQLFQYSYGYFLYQQGLKVNYILNKSYNSFGQCVDFPGIFKWDDKKLKLIAPKGILKNICLFFTKLWAKYIVRNYNTGYYQDAKTVETVSEKNNNLKLKLNFIREEKYKNSTPYKFIKNEKVISVHIRGGDYHSEPKYSDVCNIDYYKKAIAMLSTQYPTYFFLVFTNDCNYAKSIFQDLTTNIKLKFMNDFIYEESLLKDPGFDLFLMSQCEHNIIANSTYSWWGAFLNNNQNKNVIAPKNWLNSEFVTPDILDISNRIIPESWIKI